MNEIAGVCARCHAGLGPVRWSLSGLIRPRVLLVVGLALALLGCGTRSVRPAQGAQDWRAETSEAVLKGEALYRLDRMAVVATTAYRSFLLRDGTAQPRQLAGWVVSAIPEGGAIISWVMLDDWDAGNGQMDDSGWIETQILFSPSANPGSCAALNTPAACAGIETLDRPRELTADERAQLRIRQWLRRTDMKLCTKRPANLLVVRDRSQWLAYVFSSAEPGQWVVKGHSRVEFDAAAQEFQSLTPLYDRCQVEVRPAPGKELTVRDESAAYVHETHVLLALQTGRSITVVGNKGVPIRIDPQGSKVQLRVDCAAGPSRVRTCSGPLHRNRRQRASLQPV